MKFKFKNKKISAIITVIPKNEISFDDESANFRYTPKQMKRLKEVMGFDKRRVAAKGTTFSDMAVFGLEKLFSEGLLHKDDIGGIILTTQTPDYFLPPTSNIIQGNLNLSPEIYCIDINQGCAGYIVGLIQAFQLLEHMTDKKVLLISGELGGKAIEGESSDRNVLLRGDAVCISVVENGFSENTTPINAEVIMEGNRWRSIRKPEKPFKEIFATEETVTTSELEFNFMDGLDVGKFTQVNVPPIIERVIKDSGMTKDDIDWFLLHQPNRFLVNSVIEQLKIPPEKAPNNLVGTWGNTASATIPAIICLNLVPDILTKTFNVCMSGFGVGFTVGAMTMQLGPLKFCEFAEY